MPIGGRCLLNFLVPEAALIRVRRLIERGDYSSKYGGLSFGVASSYSSEFARVISVLRLCF